MDGAWDSGDPRYGSWFWPRYQTASPGATPLWAFLSGASTTLSPELKLIGEPAIGQSFALLLTQAGVQTTGNPVALMIGNPKQGSLGDCTTWVDPVGAVTLNLAADPMGHLLTVQSLPLDPTFLFREFAYQFFTTSSKASNAVKIRVGGRW